MPEYPNPVKQQAGIILYLIGIIIAAAANHGTADDAEARDERGLVQFCTACFGLKEETLKSERSANPKMIRSIS